MTALRRNPPGVTGHIEGRPGDELDVHVQSSLINLGIVQGFTNQLTNVTGTLQADVRVTGSGEDPHLTGNVDIRDGGFAVPAAKTSFTGLTTRIELQQDVIRIPQFQILDQHGKPLTIYGELAVHEGQAGAVNIAIDSRRLQAHRQRARQRPPRVAPEAHRRGAAAPHRRRAAHRRRRGSRSTRSCCSSPPPVLGRGAARRRHGAADDRDERQGGGRGDARRARAGDGRRARGTRRGRTPTAPTVAPHDRRVLGPRARRAPRRAGQPRRARQRPPARRPDARRRSATSTRRSAPTCRSRSSRTRRSRFAARSNTVRGFYEFQGRRFDDRARRDAPVPRAAGDQPPARRHRASG